MRRFNILRNSMAYQLVLMMFLVPVFAFNSKAQAKKHKTVRVEVITDGDSDKVFVDTTFTHDIIMLKANNDKIMIEIDSLLKKHGEGMEKHMKVMAFNLDSLHEFDFDFSAFCGEDMEKMHIEIERAMKEHGLAMKEGKHHSPHHFYWFSDEEGSTNDVNVQTITKDGKEVKVITKQFTISDEDHKGDKKMKKYVISSSGDHPHIEKKFHSKGASIKPISLEDISVLRKAGVKDELILNNGLKVEELKLILKNTIEDDIEKSFVTIELELPENGSYELKVVDKDGELTEHDKKVKPGTLKKELQVIEDKAPYYFMLQNKTQLFGRKIDI